MNIISFATEDSNWQTPRAGIILTHGGRDTGYRLDCERLFDPSEHPRNYLSWFDMDGPWFQKARKVFDSVERDAAALDAAKEKGWLVPAQDAYWFAPVPRPGKLIEFISESITLEPGDVIATGTPGGVGFARNPPVFLKPGDEIEVLIDGIGGLGNPVAGQ
jgi:hypothetical protein